MIHLRLSAPQMSVIWPGLNRLITSYTVRESKRGIRDEYPFRIFPPPGGFNRGTFDQGYMDKISALWKELHPKAKTGGRVQMDAIELRAVIFAIRANIDYARKCRHDLRRKSHEVKAECLVDDESYTRLKVKSQRVIRSLENHLKRANRVLRKAVTQEEYTLLMDAWTAHLRWMRLRIAYFRPWPKVIRGRRIRQQKDLDDLMRMAERGIRYVGYEPPEPKELRRILRLYVRSARRGREGAWTVRYILGDRSNQPWLYLADFVLLRLGISRELPE